MKTESTIMDFGSITNPTTHETMNIDIPGVHYPAKVSIKYGVMLGVGVGIAFLAAIKLADAAYKVGANDYYEAEINALEKLGLLN